TVLSDRPVLFLGDYEWILNDLGVEVRARLHGLLAHRLLVRARHRKREGIQDQQWLGRDGIGFIPNLRDASRLYSGQGRHASRRRPPSPRPRMLVVHLVQNLIALLLDPLDSVENALLVVALHLLLLLVPVVALLL